MSHLVQLEYMTHMACDYEPLQSRGGRVGHAAEKRQSWDGKLSGRASEVVQHLHAEGGEVRLQVGDTDLVELLAREAHLHVCV